ncbi:MAG: sigma factor-like helix-turn-helix DNA-binding protein, partial [Planctomycetota bacterium]
ASAHREVVEQVLALPEHYREVLLRRFFDGQTPTEIAERTGTPVATVKTRLQRGIALLRERLDDLHGGDGRAFAVALLPLVVERPAAAGLGLSGGVFAGVLAALAAGVALVLGLWTGDSAPELEPVAARPTQSAATPLSVVDGPAVFATGPPAGPDATRLALDTAASGPPRGAVGSSLTLAPPVGEPLIVEVRDPDGRPVRDVLLAFESFGASAGTQVAIANGHGAARFERVSPPGRIRLLDERWIALAAAEVPAGTRSGRATLMVLPRLDLVGQVLDGAGLPVPGAEVDWSFRAEGGPDVASAPTGRRPVRTDGEGRFRLPRPRGVELDVAATAVGGRAVRVDVGPDDAGPVVLAFAGESRALLRGRVVGPDGGAVEGASLWCGGRDVPLVEGAFALERDVAAAGLTAWAPGRRQARVAPDPADVDATLVLESLPAFSGRVVDHAGAPVSEAWVWVAEPTLLGVRDGELPDELVAIVRPGSAGVESRLVFRERARGATLSGWCAALTDRRGRFELDGVEDAAPRLRAFAPGLGAVAEGVLADGVLALEPPVRRLPLEGRLLRQGSLPRPGGTLHAGLRLAAGESGALAWAVMLDLTGPVPADGAGWFALEELPELPLRFLVEAPGSLPRVMRLFDDETAPGRMRPARGYEFFLQPAVSVRSRGVGGPRASLTALDRQGQPLPLLRRLPNEIELYRAQAPAGLTGLMTTEAAARVEVRVEGGLRAEASGVEDGHLEPRAVGG